MEASAKPKDGAAELTFEKVDAATIAIACIHDEDDDEKLATNFLGIPKEGTAASNDAKGKMSAPSFDAAKFSFDGGTKEVVLTMGY